jgi:hypothetical protein
MAERFLPSQELSYTIDSVFYDNHQLLFKGCRVA